MQNIQDLILNSKEKYKNNTAYNLEDKKITYGKLYEDIKALGNAFKNMNVSKIAILLKNCYAWELSYLSAMSVGTVVIPIDRALTSSDILEILEKTSPDIVITSIEYVDVLKDYTCVLANENIDGYDTIESLILKHNEENVNEITIDSNALCEIIFTSGTTDKAKAVMLSQASITSNILNSAKVINLSNEDVVLSFLPLNHVLEGIFSMLLSIYFGATRVFVEDMSMILDYMEKYNVTFMCGVPAVYKLLYEELIEHNNKSKIIKNINMLFSAGAPLENDLKNKYLDIGIKLVQGYGLTETSSAVALENKYENRMGSVGKIIPNTRVQIVNRDEDGVGEIEVLSDTVMLGYYEEDKLENRDNWFKTGDLGRIDKDGYLYILGRDKELLVLASGKKVFPNELEEYINKIDGVKESIVFLDNNYITVKVVCDNDSVKAKIDNLNLILPEYKTIKNVIVTNEKLLRNTNGKIDRKREVERSISSNNKNIVNENNADNNTENIIKSIVANVLGKEASTISSDAHFVLKLGADSLDKVSIILKVEKELNIKIPKEKRKDINTINDLLKII